MIEPLAHLAVGVLGHDDGAVDEHAKAQEHPEHHHEIEGVAEQINDDDREEQRHGYSQPDDDAAAKAHGGHDDDHDQRERGHDVALELGYLDPGELRRVLRRDHANRRRKPFARLVDDGADRIDRVDHVGVGALLDLDGNRFHAVEAGVTRAVLEGAPDARDVRQGDHGITADAHGQAQHVGRLFDHGRYLDGEAAEARVQASGGYEDIVALQRAGKGLAGYSVGFERFRIDDDLQHFLTLAAQIGVEHRGDRLDVVAQGDRCLVDLPFTGPVAEQVDLDKRKIIHVQFPNDRFLRRRGNFRLAAVDGLTYVDEG